MTTNVNNGNGMEYITFYNKLTSALTVVLKQKNSEDANTEKFYAAKYGRSNFNKKCNRFTNTIR